MAALLFYGFLIEPNRIVVREVNVPSERLGRFFESAAVVHLSDLHVGGIGLRERRLLEALERIDPDYIFITGDYIQDESDPEPVLDLLARIPAKEGIWGVLGNVDYNGSRGSCRLCHADPVTASFHEDPPIRMVRNESIVIERRGKRLRLIGLDEEDARSGGPDPAAVLHESGGDDPRLVLAHTPFLAGQAARLGVDLYLAGDTHGGQVRAPTRLLEWMMPEKQWCYREGSFTVDSMPLHVSHGVGWSILPIRIGMPPEIVVLRFEEGR